MHILVADIGSTKSIWTILNKTQHQSFETIGFNPNYQSKDEISDVLTTVKNQLDISQVTSCFLYGAGIDKEDSKILLKNIVHQIFSSSLLIEINNDLLAAARSCYSDKESGIIAILGTGSNIKTYKQGQLIGESYSLGYIIGDEGGGVGFGKYLVKAFIYGNLPAKISNMLKDLGYNKTSIIDAVYNKPYPQRYLANFARVLFPYREEPSIKNLLIKNFNDFIESHVLKIENIQNKDIKFVGSMAFYFQDILKETAKKHQITIKGCFQTPIDGLIDYHKNNI